jgi:tRNA modification GTPase
VNDSPDTPRTGVCVLTAPGRGAIAVVAVTGPAAIELVDGHIQPVDGRTLSEQPLARIIYGHWNGATGEDLIVCRRGSEEVEIHCHGGKQSVARIVAALTAAGGEQVDWRQSIAQRTPCQLASEAQVALAAAATLRTAKVLLDQYHGALRQELEAIHGLLAAENSEEAAERVNQLLHLSDFGLHLTRPWRVTIIGLPNVGKSSLVNALAGYRRAIEFDQPGTTRDVVSVTTAFDGWPVELSDTAGLHAISDEVESAGVALAHDELRRADLAIWLLDATVIAREKTLSVEELASQQAEDVTAPWDRSRTLIVVNKCDLAAPRADLRGNFLAVSATAGPGIPELIETVARRLVPQSPAPQSPIPFTVRQIDLLQEALDHCRAAEIAPASDTLQRLLVSNHRQ